MDRRSLERRLAQLDRHIQLGQMHLVRQRELVHELRQDGHRTDIATRLLQSIEQLQAVYMDGHARIVAQLAEMGRRPKLLPPKPRSGWLAALRRDERHRA